MIKYIASSTFKVLNPDTTVPPSGSITYIWRIPDKGNLEGSYVFISIGDDVHQQMTYGLFGVLSVEPKEIFY